MFTLTHDEWISFHLGRPSYRLDCDAPNWKGENSSLPDNKNYFIYTKVSPEYLGLVTTLTDQGFRLVDTNIQLRADVSGLIKTHCSTRQIGTIGFASIDECSQVAALAAISFSYDRFHADLHISNDVANAIKKSWAENFFTGNRGDWMVVAQVDGLVAGFLQLLGGPNRPLTIDLIAVAPGHQGRGIARTMIAFAAANCANNGQINVGTQLANNKSLRLYQGMGFSLTHSQHVLHVHGPEILESHQ